MEKMPEELSPISIAEPFVYASTPVGSGFDIGKHEEVTLNTLDNMADDLGFINESYFVSTGRALAIPKSFEANAEVAYGSFYGLSFEGRLGCYAQVAIGKIINELSVRALCLTWRDVTLLPYMDKLGDSKLLYTPILAVESMDKTLS